MEEQIKQAIQVLNNISESEEYVALWDAIAKTQYKILMSYINAGFSREEAVQFAVTTVDQFKLG